MKQKSKVLLAPLASRMRPKKIEEFVGQTHLLAKGKPFREAIEKGMLHSMILWGPPGTGKTTLAALMSLYAKAHFLKFSAIMIGVKEIRQAVADALLLKSNENKHTILFIDEIHRFNKAQQDVLLPFIEDGTFILIGATTENPSFELNNALLSRTRVYVLKSLNEEELLSILNRALMNKDYGLGNIHFSFTEELKKILVNAADGDARQVLNLIEMCADLADANNRLVVTETMLNNLLQQRLRRFDKGGDLFYEQISALHKSVRGSAPDAALYWFVRMIDGGCDPRYIARRVIRMSVEDIGLADPNAMKLALTAGEIYERLGSPEGELAIAEAIVYLACAPKSNAIYRAYQGANVAAKKYGSLDVPMHLRNAPTKLMKDKGYGKNYRYVHDEPEKYARGENYFPENMPQEHYYHPSQNGLEIKISERLNYFRSLDKEK